jgi:hypothetical protein
MRPHPPATHVVRRQLRDLKGAGVHEPFKGVINVDVRDSKPDWTPFEPPRAPDGAPNVLYVVLDDVGFSALSCYGGPIETPNIDRIVDAGVRYTQFHTTALCSPTRSCLLTGRNHTRNSMACITEAAIGFPNASGTIPPENGMLSEVLGERGWNTYMVGKFISAVGQRCHKQGNEPICATGTLTLYHGDHPVGEATIRTQLGAFAIAGAPLFVGRHGGEPVTDDYPGEPPYTFTGGTLHQVTVDVSGEPYVDLERHAEMLLRSQ